jgi:GH15 family glucan-1,4-alpha-glucosidase
MIGDCHTAALVSKHGSIDWLCFPYFDSGACFAALLGTEKHGCWSIAPVDPVRSVRRRYRGDTLILETEFETESGSVMLVDCMTPRDEVPQVVRMAVGRRGQVRMRMELVIRFDYGSVIPWVRRTKRGISAIAGPDMLTLCTEVPVRGEGLTTLGEFTVSEGQRVAFDLESFPSAGAVDD